MEINTSTKSGSNFEVVHIEEGIYQATLKEVKDISDGQYGPRVAFIYTIKENDKEVELALVAYKLTATKDNKLGQTLMAHGVVLNDSAINTDNLPNKEVRAWVEDYTREVEEDGKKVAKVSSIITRVKAKV